MCTCVNASHRPKAASAGGRAGTTASPRDSASARPSLGVTEGSCDTPDGNTRSAEETITFP